MGQRFPAVTDKDIIKVLRKLGFEFYGQSKGSHEVWRRISDGCHTIVPRHPGKVVKRKTLKAILKDIRLSAQEFRKLL